MDWIRKGWVGRKLLYGFGSFGSGVGVFLGLAGIRGLYNTWVVIWPFRLPCSFLFLLLCSVWCEWVSIVLFPLLCWCILLNLLLFLSAELSQLLCWVLGLFRLEVSLYLGGIRWDQIFVNRKLFSVSFFVSSAMQRFENLFVRKKPACVVFNSSCWIKGKGGVSWESGEIRRPNALWVVILLNAWPFRFAVFFHSDLIFYFLGNLNLFYFLVASLFGTLTIRATSASIVGCLGFVLWGCTRLGDIRKEIAIVDRSYISFFFLFFWHFVVHGNGNQTWIFWCYGFLSWPKQVSRGRVSIKRLEMEAGHVRAWAWKCLLIKGMIFRRWKCNMEIEYCGVYGDRVAFWLSGGRMLVAVWICLNNYSWVWFGLGFWVQRD
ncbi:hypothetical protein Hanom_Chr12g01181051 [Helianthus anomalus]